MSLLSRGLDALFGRRAPAPSQPRVEPGLNLPPARELNVRLTGSERIANDTVKLTFAPVDGPLFRWVAGQHATLIFDVDPAAGLRRETRIYSLWNPPDGAADAQLVLKLMPFGRASDTFRGGELGRIMPMVGPQGSFAWRPALPESLCLVGTGTGYSPLRAMLLELERRGGFDRHRVRLLWGLRSAADAFGLDELARLAHEHPSFELTFALSGPGPLPTDWPGRIVAGRVTKVLSELPPSGQVYLCGNGQMILDACALLEPRGLTRENGGIVYEKFFDAPFGGIAGTRGPTKV